MSRQPPNAWTPQRRRQVQPRQQEGLTPESLPKPGNSSWRSTSGLLRQHWRLEHVPEQSVLKAGLLRLQRLLSGNVSDSPKAKAKVLRASFFERLANGGVELKACPPTDVSAAQGDLRYLSLDELLALKISTHDFPTTKAGNLNVHRNFLAALGSELFDKIGQRALAGKQRLQPQGPRRLEVVGIQFALCLGAAELAVQLESPDTRAEPLPSLWLTPLPEEAFADCSFLLTCSSEVWAEVLPGKTPDLKGPANGRKVAMVMDLESGTRDDRLLHWEITSINPVLDDVPKALALVRAKRRRGFGVAVQRPQPAFSALDEALEAPVEPVLPSSPLAATRYCEVNVIEAKKAGAAVEWPSPTTATPFSEYEYVRVEKEESSFLTKLLGQMGCCASSSGRRAEFQ